MTLAAVVAHLVDTLGAMDGIVRAYDDPPESLSEFPCLLAYAGSGQLELVSAGLGKSIHTVVVEIHHSRTIIQEAVDAAKVWPDRVMAALYADQRSPSSGSGGIVWPVTYEAIPLPYSNEVHYGVRFRIPVKDMVAL